MLRIFAFCAAFGVLTAACRANFDPSTFDRSVKPQNDFYGYVDNVWVKTTPIPAFAPAWSAYRGLRDRAAQNTRVVCERASAMTGQGATADEMVGDFYASGLDDEALARNGAEPLRFEFDRLDALQTPAAVFLEMAHLQAIGVPVGFRFAGAVDPEHPESQIARLSQGGLGLPARDDYLLPRDSAEREKYAEHIVRTLNLLGTGDHSARKQAAAILEIETALARASSGPAAPSDPLGGCHLMSVMELEALAPGLDWTGFFAQTGAPAFTELDVAQPRFFAAFAAQMRKSSVTGWRAYLRWHFIHTYAPYLSDPFMTEDFSFYGAFLGGAPEPALPWRRVVDTLNGTIGGAVGRLYLSTYFAPKTQMRIERIVDGLRAALRSRVRTLPWMDETTRERALAKLDLMSVAIGGPGHPEDYHELVIDRGPYVLNVLKARAWGARRGWKRIGQPTDPAQWRVDADSTRPYYDPARNRLEIPAGLLLPPFFDPEADEAVNYGAVGAAIAAEMIHVVDARGRYFDGHGKLGDWWTPETARRFRTQAGRIDRQLDAERVTSSLPLNGRLVENGEIAVLGGVKVAYLALENALGKGPAPAKIAGFTPEQRFFLSFAAAHRATYRPGILERLAKSSARAPAQIEVNDALSNLPEFAKAFAISDGTPMRRSAADRAVLW
ncbi:MAG: M13 family metallopeptidase [Opitutaceae bacterium]